MGDRRVTTVAGLAAIGAEVEELPDGWRVARGTARDASVQTHGDHRLAIAFAVPVVSGKEELDRKTLEDVVKVTLSVLD